MTLLPSATLSHFGINVTDIDLIEGFYTRVFGFCASDRGVRFNGQKVVFLTKSAHDHHQLVLLEGRPAEPGFNVVNQISFQLPSLEHLRNAFAALKGEGRGDLVQVDHGNAWSLYFKDPEDNPVEVFADSPFHTPQPCRGELDLALDAAEILARTEAMCRSRPGFLSHAQWQQSTADRLARELQTGAAGA